MPKKYVFQPKISFLEMEHTNFVSSFRIIAYQPWIWTKINKNMFSNISNKYLLFAKHVFKRFIYFMFYILYLYIYWYILIYFYIVEGYTAEPVYIYIYYTYVHIYLYVYIYIHIYIYICILFNISIYIFIYSYILIHIYL